MQLTPAPCSAGLWQPLRLVGHDVETTLLVRATRDPLIDALALPPLKLVGEKLGSLRVEGLPPIELSDAQVQQCVAWSSVVLGLIGIEEEGLFPRPAHEMLLPDGAFPPDANGEAAAEREAAAVLLLPNSVDLRSFDALRDPSRWERTASGAWVPEAESWPTDERDSPYVVLRQKRPRVDDCVQVWANFSQSAAKCTWQRCSLRRRRSRVQLTA